MVSFNPSIASGHYIIYRWQSCSTEPFTQDCYWEFRGPIQLEHLGPLPIISSYHLITLPETNYDHHCALIILL